MVSPGGGMSWYLRWYVVWPDGHGMVYGMMARRASHSILYGLVMHSMVYGIAWRAWHGIRFGIKGMAW